MSISPRKPTLMRTLWAERRWRNFDLFVEQKILRFDSEIELAVLTVASFGTHILQEYLATRLVARYFPTPF